MALPLVSVIIPTYNVEQYIGECLDSVLSQTLRDLEIICVDDCSTDSSPAILAEYAARDSRLRVLRQPSNMRPGAARNRGMDEARGKYLYFMDADDTLAEPSALMELSTLADEHDLDHIVFTAESVIDGTVDPELARRVERVTNACSISSDICGKVMSGHELFDRLKSAGQYTPCSWCRLMRTEAIRETGFRFPAHLKREDSLFTPQVLLSARRAYALDRKLYRRRIRQDSIMTTSGLEEQGYLASLENLRTWIGGIGRFAGCGERPNAADRVTAMMMRSLGVSFYRLGEEASLAAIRRFDYSDAFDESIAAILSLTRESLSKREQLIASRDATRQQRDSLRIKLEKLNSAHSRLKDSHDRLKASYDRLKDSQARLKDSLLRTKKARDARPNSIRGCLSFIVRRVLEKLGLRRPRPADDATA